MPDGTIRKAVQPDACGQARRGVEGRILPPAGGAMTPLQKLGPPPLCVTAPCKKVAPLPTLVVRSSHEELPHLQRGLVLAA